MIGTTVGSSGPFGNGPGINAMLQRNGFVYLPPGWYQDTALAHVVENGFLTELSAQWDTLAPDPYLPDGGQYRSRRFGRYDFDRDTACLVPRKDAGVFMQENAFVANQSRVFPPLTPQVRDSVFLTNAVRLFAYALPTVQHHQHWLVNIHTVRILCGQGRDGMGQPTPEGIHRDGHHYVVQLLIARRNVAGAVSTIYAPDLRPLYQHTLQMPLEGIVVDDRRVYHDVTPFEPVDPEQLASRDMLLIDYNPS